MGLIDEMRKLSADDRAQAIAEDPSIIDGIAKEFDAAKLKVHAIEIARLQSERDVARREKADADRYNEKLRTTVSMLIGMAEGRDVDAVDASRLALARSVLAGEIVGRTVNNAPGPCVCGILEALVAAVASQERGENLALPKTQNLCDAIRDRFEEVRGGHPA